MISVDVTVNGTAMDRGFFEDNLKEARAITWKMIFPPEGEDHFHCMVCTAPISTKHGVPVYSSGRHYLCGYCFEHFFKRN